MEPGVYTDAQISMDAYNADPCPQPSLRSSIAATLFNKTPYHAWCEHPRLNPNYTRESKNAFDFGAAVHSSFLGTGPTQVILPYDDYRKKDAQKARDEAYDAGMIPLTLPAAAAVDAAVNRLSEQMAAHEEGRHIGAAAKEVTIIWTEGEGDDRIWLRSRIDALNIAAGLAFDLKTDGKDVDPEHLARKAADLDYDLQAAMVQRAVRAAYGVKIEPRIAAVEALEPHAACVIGFSGDYMQMARQKLNTAIKLWRQCMKSGHWPDYGTMTYHVEPPRYLDAQVSAAMMRHELLSQFYRPITIAHDGNV